MLFWPRLLSQPYGHLLRGSDREKFGWDERLISRTKLSEPLTISVNDPVDKATEFIHLYRARDLVKVRGATVSPFSGTVSLNRVGIAESTSWNPQKVFFRRFGRADLLPKSSTHHQVFLAQKKWNYYHFLVEDFPLIIQARQEVGEIEAVVGADVPKFALEALNLLSVPSLKIRRDMELEELLFITRSNDTGWPHPDDVDSIRRAFSPARVSDDVADKIYVSRRYSARALPHEREVEGFFLSRGFQVVVSERLTFSQQVDLYSKASVMVGPHGAGLANAVFMPEGSLLVELFSRDNANPCFEILAKTAGLKYAGVQLSSQLSAREHEALLESLRVF